MAKREGYYQDKRIVRRLDRHNRALVRKLSTKADRANSRALERGEEGDEGRKRVDVRKYS